jgi:hypothetical protein
MKARSLLVIALLLALVSSGQAYGAVNFEGFTTLAGNGRQIAVYCKDGKIVTAMEQTSVGVILPLQPIGKKCDATMFDEVFPGTVITSIDDPRLGWVDAIDDVSICIGSSLTKFSTSESSTTVNIILDAEECPL